MTDSGIGSSAERSPSSKFTIVCFITIAMYNVIELNFIIFSTFKNRYSLYFYSFLISTWGIAVYVVGFLIKDFQISSIGYFYCTLIFIGWCCMVTGQSVVLYSRLHLILRNPFTLRLVLAMIVVNAIICHAPIGVLVFGANSHNPEPFLMPYSIYEKVQVTIFFIQELIISGLYIIHTVKILRPEGDIRGKSRRQAMTHLIYVNAVIVMLDVTILGLEYSGLYNIQTAYKGFAYSLKLKLEFDILNRLVSLTKSGAAGCVHNSHSRSQPGGERSVHMETFDGMAVSKRDTMSRQVEQRAGYSAYVHSGGKTEADGASGEGIKAEDEGIVVMTTEIAVRSDAITAEKNFPLGESRASRSLSISGRSGVTVTSVGGGPKEYFGLDDVVNLTGSQVELAGSGHLDINLQGC